MTRRKSGNSTTSPGLFADDLGAIPVGMAEPCAGCGSQVDLRMNGWAVLGNRTFVHAGEECWRKAVWKEEQSI